MVCKQKRWWLQKRSVSCKCVLLWMSKGCAWSRSHCTAVCPRFLWRHAAHCVSLWLTGSLCWFVLFSHKLSDSCHLHPDPRQLWTGPQNNAAVTRPWEHTFNHTIIISKTSWGHVRVVFHPKIRRNKYTIIFCTRIYYILHTMKLIYWTVLSLHCDLFSWFQFITS